MMWGCCGAVGAVALGFRRVWLSMCIGAKVEVEVLGHSGRVTDAKLDGHAAFDHPHPRLTRGQAKQNSFEHHPTAEAIEVRARLASLVEQSLLEGLTEGTDRLIGHSTPAWRRARSIRSASRCPRRSASRLSCCGAV